MAPSGKLAGNNIQFVYKNPVDAQRADGIITTDRLIPDNDDEIVIVLPGTTIVAPEHQRKNILGTEKLRRKVDYDDTLSRFGRRRCQLKQGANVRSTFGLRPWDQMGHEAQTRTTN